MLHIYLPVLSLHYPIIKYFHQANPLSALHSNLSTYGLVCIKTCDCYDTILWILLGETSRYKKVYEPRLTHTLFRLFHNFANMLTKSYTAKV